MWPTYLMDVPQEHIREPSAWSCHLKWVDVQGFHQETHTSYFWTTESNYLCKGSINSVLDTPTFFQLLNKPFVTWVVVGNGGSGTPGQRTETGTRSRTRSHTGTRSLEAMPISRFRGWSQFRCESWSCESFTLSASPSLASPNPSLSSVSPSLVASSMRVTSPTP